MRKTVNTILRKRFHEALVQIRGKKAWTQSKMAQLLCMDDRSYIDLDHGKTSCSAVTLALFLIYVCEDVNGFLEDLRRHIEAAWEQTA